MSAQVVIPLAEVSRFSSAVVGSRALKWAEYDAQALPIPQTLIVPVTTLQTIAEENDLAKFFTKKELHQLWRDPAERHTVKQSLRATITKQHLPDWFTRPLLEKYHTQFQRGFVRLLPSDTAPNFDSSRFEHIQGDANLFESFKECWADWVVATLELEHTLQHSVLTPGAIIIQEQIQPYAAGLAHSRHPKTANKSQVFIAAIKGTPDQELLSSEADQFAVDIRTWNVVYRQVVSQTRMYERTTDKLESLPIPFAEQLEPTLTDEQCIELAQLINQFKKHYIAHAVISWELGSRGFIFTNFQEDSETITQKSSATKTVTKLYISAGNPYKAPNTTQAIDGVGVLRSEYVYAQFGIHPAQIVHSRQREVLQRALSDCITQYQAAISHQRVLFRSQNFNSQESRRLEYGSSHEPVEDNPYLGYRGGLKMVSQPELLRLELEAVRTALKNTTGALGYMLSFVRTPQELSALIHHVEISGTSQDPKFELWMQLNTPENILNLAAYPTHKLTGVSVNIRTLQALLHGIDPDNPEVFERYELDEMLLERMLELLTEMRRHLNTLRPNGTSLQLNIHLEDFSSSLVAVAVKLGYDGVVVKPRSIEIARGIILEEEERKLQKI